MTWFEKKAFETEISADVPLFSTDTKYSSPQDTLTPEHDHEYARKDVQEIPLSAFSCGASTLRTVVKYLKDVAGLPYGAIAAVLNRDYQTIVTTYKAFPADIAIPLDGSAIKVPVDIFSGKGAAPLEAIVSFLKSLGLTYAEIAILIKRDQRTVWTAYHRKIAKEGLQ